MGHHFMNDEIFFDGVVAPLRPELLVYVPTEHGGRRLVAVEYLVFSSALGFNPVPELFGHTFHPNQAIDASVPHVWRWAMNPRSRKRVVEGKSVAVRVELGGCVNIKKKKRN